MGLGEAIAWCLAMKGAEETTPFGPDVLVYKVATSCLMDSAASEC